MPDRSAQVAPLLRDVVGQANGMLRLEAQELGVANARYKMRCDASGAVAVVPAKMPRADAEVTFATLISDLRAQGHDSPYAKYWVWYDGTRGDLYGQGQVYPNDRLASSNGNAKGNGFSVVWGLLDPLAFVHETTHTMGGVQRTAPNTSGNWHCIDGLDVMCYRDSADSAYNATVCQDRVHLDCNHDDYFHPSPAAGSYLATHWNVAHRYNRFLDFGRPNEAPQVPPVACAPAVVDFDQPTTCKVFADDDSDGIAYYVSLDGGPAQRVPATGWLIAGHALPLTGSWPAPGEHTWRVLAFDDAKKGLPSNVATATVRVGCALDRAGNLTAGLAGAPEDASTVSEGGIPRACSGAAYRLTGSMGADVDVCWQDAAGIRLACGTALGDETGAIPQGARSAKVYLKAGAAATYALRAG
jgi:hypothetical protein